MLKTFGHIERVVKSDFFLGKDLFYVIRAQHVLSYHLIYHAWLWNDIKLRIIYTYIFISLDFVPFFWSGICKDNINISGYHTYLSLSLHITLYKVIHLDQTAGQVQFLLYIDQCQSTEMFWAWLGFYISIAYFLLINLINIFFFLFCQVQAVDSRSSFSCPTSTITHRHDL